MRDFLFPIIHCIFFNPLLTVSILFYSPALFGGFRRWVQAVFRVSDGSNSSSSKEGEANHLDGDDIDKVIQQNNLNDGLNDSAIDMSEGVAADMFGVLPSSEYEVRLSPFVGFCKFSQVQINKSDFM